MKCESEDKKPGEYERPITIKRVLENDITPSQEEYAQLKDLVFRLSTMNILKLSTNIAQGYGGPTELWNR